MHKSGPVSSLLPATAWLARYPRAWLGPDVVAGLTTAAVVIPKAMAYATIAFAGIALLHAFAPRAPAPLVVVAGAIAASLLFGLPDAGVSVVGAIPGGLPAFTLPDRALLMPQVWRVRHPEFRWAIVALAGVVAARGCADGSTRATTSKTSSS